MELEVGKIYYSKSSGRVYRIINKYHARYSVEFIRHLDEPEKYLGYKTSLSHHTAHKVLVPLEGVLGGLEDYV